MDLSPEEKRRIYEEEKARIEAKEQVKRELKEKRPEKRKKGCLGCLGVIVLLFLLSIIANLNDLDTSSYRGRTVSNNRSYSNRENRIYAEGLESIFVATNEKYFNELIKASKSYDSYTLILTLVGTGNVFNIPNNTKVKVLSTEYAKIKAYRVRILEGAFSGRIV